MFATFLKYKNSIKKIISRIIVMFMVLTPDSILRVESYELIPQFTILESKKFAWMRFSYQVSIPYKQIFPRQYTSTAGRC